MGILEDLAEGYNARAKPEPGLGSKLTHVQTSLESGIQELNGYLAEDRQLSLRPSVLNSASSQTAAFVISQSGWEQYTVKVRAENTATGFSAQLWENDIERNPRSPVLGSQPTDGLSAVLSTLRKDCARRGCLSATTIQKISAHEGRKPT
jgi:hypothetical protein